MSTKEFRNGDHVMIDVDKITNYVEYKRFLPEYRKFVEKSRGKVFTIRKEGRLYTFKELPENGWLFWSEDLIPVGAM